MKKKPFFHALAHCISADATMSQGIAVEQFQHLRRRVESERSVKDTVVALSYSEDEAGVYNQVTKQRCWEKPTIRDVQDS